MDERKGGADKIVKIEEPKKDENKGAGLIVEEKVEAKKDIFDLSSPMSEEEIAEYGDTPHIVIDKLKVKAPLLFPNVEEYDLE